jgi:hypothetical protein
VPPLAQSSPAVTQCSPPTPHPQYHRGRGRGGGVQTVWVVITDEKPTENMHPLSQKGLKELTLLLLENIAIELSQELWGHGGGGIRAMSTQRRQR